MSLTQVLEGGFSRHCSATGIIIYSITIPPSKRERSARCRRSSPLSAGSATGCCSSLIIQNSRLRQQLLSSAKAAQAETSPPKAKFLSRPSGLSRRQGRGALGLTEKMSPPLLLYLFYYLIALLPCRWSLVKRQNSRKKAQIWSTQRHSQISLES